MLAHLEDTAARLESADTHRLAGLFATSCGYARMIARGRGLDPSERP